MTWKARFDGEEPQRINKWLAQQGVCSRREAEALIAEGRVRIDGKRVDDLGRKIAHGETLEVDAAQAQATYVLNKPVGYVSAQPERGQIPAARLLTQANLAPGWRAEAPARNASLAPLGRLDQDSRGLLLLSEDGVLAKAVIGADSELDKEYVVAVEGVLNAKKLALLRFGLALDGKPLKRAEVRQEGAQLLRFTLREGKKRQIRRMCQAVDLHVVDLLRVRIGTLELGDLPEGRWRLLEQGERQVLIGATA